ncbi:MAG TPA: hypothetical protein VK399_11305 [Longimicrobiaceae bacterium]|jgi:hypothetical protein|nr:hypothetical protein [Longimicrobiaceae bacterium]
MSVQLESRHYFMARDTVQNAAGVLGEVVEAMALYAVVRWEDGREEEVDQLDPWITVIERASRE